MKRVETFNIVTLALTFLALVPKMESQVRPPVIPLPPGTPRPLCASQFALANYACARLPIIPLGSPPSPSKPQPSSSSPDDDHDHDHDHDDDKDDEGNGHDHHHGHGHRHGHGHGHRHGHSQTPLELDCCRWASEVDSECVCEILARLPPFLMRPLHKYTITIGIGCSVTYPCAVPPV